MDLPKSSLTFAITFMVQVTTSSLIFATGIFPQLMLIKPGALSFSSARKYKAANKPKGRKDDATKRFPFLEYAVIFIFNHADHAEENGMSQKSLLGKFNATDGHERQKWIDRRNLFQAHQVRRYKDNDTLLYILSEQNMYNLVRRLLIECSDVDGSGERYGNALQAACANGHEQTARILVESGHVDVNEEGGDHICALLAPIFSRNNNIVELIRNKGGTIPKRCLDSKLIPTIQRKYVLGVEVLLQQGANVNAGRKEHDNALQTATYLRQQQIVQILLDNGADVNAEGGKHGSDRGEPKIVQMLLDKGANVNAQASNTLTKACNRGNRKIVEMLLRNGANVHEQGGSALRVASINGHEDIVQLLLVYGAGSMRKA